MGTAPYENNGKRSPNNRRILVGQQESSSTPQLKPNPIKLPAQSPVQKTQSQTQTQSQTTPSTQFAPNQTNQQQHTDASYAGTQAGQIGMNQIGQYAQDQTNFILQQYDRKMADTKFQELQATHGVTGIQEAIDDINKVKEAVQQ